MSRPESEVWLKHGHVKRVLQWSLRLTIVVCVSLGLGMAITGQPRTAGFAATVALLSGVLLGMAHKGFVSLVSWLSTLSLLALGLVAMATSNGLNDSALVIIPGVLLLGALVLGPRFLPVIFSVAALGIAGIAWGEMSGGLQTPTGATRHWGELIEVIVLLGIEAVLIHALFSALKGSLSDSQAAERSGHEIFNATHEAIFIHDAETGGIRDVNEAALSMYRATREQLIGLPPSELGYGQSPYDEQHAIAHIKKAITEGPQTFDWRGRRMTGEPFWAEVSLRAVELGGKSSVLALIRDSSDRHALEKRVKDAEKLTAVGQLAGGIAHDFNNQLTAIAGNAEYLSGKLSLEGEEAESLKAIFKSAGRAAELTRQLLEFARKGRVMTVPVSLHRIAEEVASLVRRSFDKKYEIRLMLNAERVVVLGDPSALQNALLNLTLNARDAMPEGGTIALTSEDVELADGQEGIALFVSDAGVGIPEEVLGRIFEPFFTTRENGTGMGLAAVYGTVQAHQGRIEVESTPGDGCVFRLTFPSKKPVEETATPSLRPGSIEPKTGKGRVLIVDDEVLVGEVAKKALELDGYQIDLCHSGQEALKLFSKGRYRAVLLDVAMPGMDGVELLNRLREQERDLPAVLMSGHPGQALRGRLGENAQVPLLGKPFRIGPLREIVRDALHGAH